MRSTSAVDVERHHEPPDPEFGSFRPGLLSGDLDGDPEAYLRLVANPFLGFVFLVAWLVVLYEAVIGGFAGALTPILVVMLLPALALIPHIMQFHCLDCGRTGPLLRWRKHVCHRALDRRTAGRPRRLRGPSPPLQIVLWLWGLVALALLLNALGVILPAP